MDPFFPRMRSKGSHFTLGVWGLRVCSLVVAFMYVRNHPQPFATVRNHPQPFATATVRNRPREPRIWPCLDKFCKLLEVSHMALLRFAWQAWHFVTFIQTCLVTCRKSFCVVGAILLRRFRNMRCSFRGRRSTLDVSISSFCGAGAAL